MTETQAAATPSSGPDKGSRGGVLSVLRNWLRWLVAPARRRTRETVAEMRKVLWPSRKEMTTYTVVVVIFVVIMMALVAAMDFAFAKAVLSVFG